MTLGFVFTNKQKGCFLILEKSGLDRTWKFICDFQIPRPQGLFWTHLGGTVMSLHLYLKFCSCFVSISKNNSSCLWCHFSVLLSSCFFILLLQHCCSPGFHTLFSWDVIQVSLSLQTLMQNEVRWLPILPRLPKTHLLRSPDYFLPFPVTLCELWNHLAVRRWSWISRWQFKGCPQDLL